MKTLVTILFLVNICFHSTGRDSWCNQPKELQDFGKHSKKASCKWTVLCCNMRCSCCSTWIMGASEGAES